MMVICPKCELLMPPEKIGVRVEAMAAWGSYQVSAGDLYKCPDCGFEVIAVVNPEPITEHYRARYAEELATHLPETRFWWNPREKLSFEPSKGAEGAQ